LKGFQVDPFSYEVLEPDYLSGELDTIRNRRLKTCQGGYFNIMAFPLEVRIDLNVKRCETSVYDWIAESGVYEEGMHIYCYYEPGNEIQLVKPVKFDGYVSQ